MSDDPSARISELLARCDAPVSDGVANAGPAARAAADELFAAVYDELRRLAQAYLRDERGDHTLQATGLVHEAYLRLVRQDRVAWQGRRHFFAVGAQVMRRLLVDHARHKRSAKRGGDWQKVSFAEEMPRLGRTLDPLELIALDRALARLAELDPRQVQVVELRYFAGLEVDEVAGVLGVSKRTVEGDWTHARAWLRRELTAAATTAPPDDAEEPA